MTEGATVVEIDGGRPIWVVTFSANGEYLVSGDDKAVRLWRVASGEEVGTMAAYDVRSIAVSRNGRQIAAGTELGRFTVWDAHTHRTIFTHKENINTIKAVDFSPDSTRLLTGSGNCTASVWDFAAEKRVLGPLHHPHGVVAAKYSLQGDRIATACATPGFVRVYDSRSGQSLIDIAINVAVYCNIGLTWSNDGHRLFVVSDGKIQQLQVSTGSAVEEWPVDDYRSYACITLSKRGEFMACSSNRTVSFLDPSTGTKFGQGIKHDQDVHSIALSPDDRVLATSSGDRKITIRSLQDTLTSSSFSGPFIYVGGAVLDSWMQGQLDKTEALLTEDIESENLSPRALAHRALIRSRLKQWDAAKGDAEKSINTQPSVIGLIAKSVALVGAGKKQDGYRACDLAFKHCPSDCVDILLAIKAVVVCIAEEYVDAISRVGDLIATTQDNFIYHTLQAYMRLLYGNSCVKRGDYKDAIQLFELAQAQTRPHESQHLAMISLIFGWKFDDLHVRIRRDLCEALYEADETEQAGEALLKMVNTVAHATNVTEHHAWICGFIQRCLSTPESSSDTASEADRQEQASTSSLGPSTPMLLLAGWSRIKLASSPWKDVLAAAVEFTVPRIMIYRATCEHLEVADGLTDAIDCYYQMVNELAITQDEEAKWRWILDFRHRCSRKLEDLGDAATKARQHDEAISRYSAALALKPTNQEALLVKRSKAYVELDSSENALKDADEIIKLDPSSPLGYERKHAALRGARRYRDAIDAFKTMLSKMSESSDPEIRDRVGQYVQPEDTEETIRMAVRDAVRDLPRVLINTTSGHLLDKSQQVSMFESSEAFTELVSSTTTYIDTPSIEDKVAQYYRYATFSHTWEQSEPLFENVVHIVVYDLEKSPTHDKLQMFCKIVRDAGFNWAWSDNCCINKQDHSVRDEALVAMFRWYEGAALVIVFLRGVCSPSKRGDLARSIWNTRAWTFQEYHAAKVVQFYTEDWTPFLNIDIPNHKESPEIISEMELATGISAPALRALQPGLNDIREKLSLASQREATYVEDKAYSLFGIFSVSLPVRYGEGDMALGRLLAHLLASSGDTSILAWTGKSGTFNSCLPASITVFDQLPTSHIPPALKETTMDLVTARLHAPPLNLNLAMRLYEQLSSLSVPSVSGKRIRIPCIIFKLGHPKRTSKHAFRAKTDALGIVEITTTEDLSRLDSIYLIHPWVDFLLDRRPVGGGEDLPAEADEPLSCGSSSLPGPSNIPLISQRTPTVVSRLRQSLSARRAKPIYDSASLSSPSRVSLTDKRTQVLQFIARLRRPFGSLLLTPIRHNIAEYRRVATDSMITVQIQEYTPLNELIANVQMLDLL